MDKVRPDLLLVPLGNVLNDFLGLFYATVTQQPARTFWQEEPVTEKEDSLIDLSSSICNTFRLPEQ